MEELTPAQQADLVAFREEMLQKKEAIQAAKKKSREQLTSKIVKRNNKTTQSPVSDAD